MKTIKFSEIYEKMPCYSGSPPKYAILLEVFKVKTKELHPRFIEYDTIYFDKEKNNFSYYQLAEGEVLILLLKSEFSLHQELWTTIRRFTPQKYEYYKNSKGEQFKIDIAQ